jgi:hypothetical protein
LATATATTRDPAGRARATVATVADRGMHSPVGIHHGSRWRPDGLVPGSSSRATLVPHRHVYATRAGTAFPSDLALRTEVDPGLDPPRPSASLHRRTDTKQAAQ